MIPGSPTDRLNVFISSTIKECAAERASAREAVTSVNHNPVLFEEVGARPYSPRDVYLPRLKQAHVFVGIYRHSYGWVAPDMDISGLEDEYNVASEIGIDRLIYIFSDDDGREERLQHLIDDAMRSNLTIAFYSDPSDLEECIRDDLTAVVSQRFVGELATSKVDDPAVVVRSLIEVSTPLIRRPALEQMVTSSLERVGSLALEGPFGSGKTTLLAQLALENNWLFLDATGMSETDVYIKAANALRARRGLNSGSFATVPEARDSCLQSWAQLADLVLVIDGFDGLHGLWGLVSTGKGRIIVASRQPLTVPAEQRVEVPRLDRGEMSKWFEELRSRPGTPSELEALFSKSEGLPLYLRFYAANESARAELSLREIEVKTLRGLSARAREIVSCLVIAATPLSLRDLSDIAAFDAGAEELAQVVDEARVLLQNRSGDLSVIHQHTRATLAEHIRSEGVRCAFFVARVGEHLERKGALVEAFGVFHTYGEHRRADSLVKRASQQALFRGGGKPALPVVRRQFEIASAAADAEDLVIAGLNLHQILRDVSEVEEAKCVLKSTAEHAAEAGQARLVRMVDEAALHLESDADLRLGGLIDLREAYLHDGDRFNAERLGTQICAERLTRQEFSEAAKLAREALEYFEGIGDSYGVSVARANLASALGGLPHRREEALQAARYIGESGRPGESPRARAVICNLLTRHHRELGDYELAARYALEAIDIASELGNQHLIAINTINLGNVRRDEGDRTQALADYKAADVAAANGGHRRDEAAANRLIADLLNDHGEHATAAIHARHAIAMSRMVGDRFLQAQSGGELARALMKAGNHDGSVRAYADAAAALGTRHGHREELASLLEAGLVQCCESQDQGVLRAFLEGAQGDQVRDSARSIIDLAQDFLCNVCLSLDPDRAMVVVGYVASAVWNNAAPERLERQFVLSSIRRVIDSGFSDGHTTALSAVVGLLAVSDWDCLSAGDVVAIAEAVTSAIPFGYYRTKPDGGAHWTLALEMGGPVALTIEQVGGDSRTAMTCLCISLMVAALSKEIRQHVLDVIPVPRSEATILVVRRKEFDEEIEESPLIGVGELGGGFTVSQSSNVEHCEQPPTVVICEDVFAHRWKPSSGAPSDLQCMLGAILESVTPQLLVRRIEQEVLYPKISRLVRQIAP